VTETLTHPIWLTPTEWNNIIQKYALDWLKTDPNDINSPFAKSKRFDEENGKNYRDWALHSVSYELRVFQFPLSYSELPWWSESYGTLSNEICPHAKIHFG
jgi:hypothetical protein